MEKEYVLVTKSGEKIKKTKAFSLEMAIEFFSELKKMKAKDLLTIYDVQECS